jgi:PTS system ascorbate-specific IIB component
MGFGTSMMLKLFIDDILKAEGLKAETIPWDLGTFKGQQADIVVAPTDMEMHLRSTKAKVVLIRNLVDKKEIREKVLAAINEIQGKSQ